jgi:two-component system, OmpR family, phosphate regulon sensor histidine kinase PhoR
MTPVWFTLLARLLAVGLAGLIAAAFFGVAAGLAVACAALLSMLVAHTAHLSRLQRWLKSPEQRDIPDAWGAWGNVFVDLYRMLRRERKVRARVESDLEVFSQAAEASPDGLVFLDAEDHIVWCNRVAEQHLGLRGERDVGLLVTNLIRLPRFAEFVASAREGD